MRLLEADYRTLTLDPSFDLFSIDGWMDGMDGVMDRVLFRFPFERGFMR